MTNAMPVHSTPSIDAENHDCIGIACSGQDATANGSTSSADVPSVAAATAAGGRPVRCRRTRLMPMPYRHEAVAPAITAQPMLAPAILLPASTTPQANPAHREHGKEADR